MKETSDTKENIEQGNDFVQINSKEELVALLTLTDLIAALKIKAAALDMVVHLTFSDSGK